MKSVLISIKPKWCKLIESGQKTIDVRKTRPKLETPFKCFIYCTADKHDRFICRGGEDMPFDVGNGMVIGEFVCDDLIFFGNIGDTSWYRLLGNVHEYGKSLVVNQALLTEQDMLKYGGKYGWHISDLKIYDKPKELSEFKGRKLVWRGNNHIHEYEKLTRPPQSWCYVEEFIK